MHNRTLLCNKKERNNFMKFKTLRRLLVFLTIMSVVNAVVATLIVMYAYGALLDFVEPPFAIIFSGVLAVLVTTGISTIIGNIFIKAYKDSQRSRRRRRN